MQLCLLAVLSCSDDDAQDALMIDAGAQPAMRDAGKPDAHIDAALDGAHPQDGSVDAGDAGGEVCKRDPLPVRESSDRTGIRIPLAVFCDNTRCPPSLAAFMSTLSCIDPDVDAGNDADGGPCSGGPRWLRREGCGKVEFDTWGCDYPRDYSFHADTGALIGGARIDDIAITLRGTTCFAAAYVAGELLMDCANEERSLCFLKP